LPYYQDHKFRADTVKAYEFVFSLSQTNENGEFDPHALDDIDIDLWKKKTLEWAHEQFDVAPDGQSNIIHAVLHNDESNPHIHMVVIPIDERGRFNASRWTGSPSLCSEQQTSYAEAVKDAGLIRGVRKSSASYQSMRQLYGQLAKGGEVPEVQPGETAEEFRARAMEQMTLVAQSTIMKANQHARHIVRQADRHRNEVDEEGERSTIAFRRHHRQLEQQNDDLTAKNNALAQKNEQMEQTLLSMQLFIDGVHRDERKAAKVAEYAKQHSDFLHGVDLLEGTDPDRARAIREMYEEMRELGEQDCTTTQNI
jgi:hypothetical protein